MSDITLHHLAGSPNSVKVRIALAYKGLDYTANEFALDGFPGTRDAVVALSRQPRLPVLEHGGTTVFDSNGIIRYLEANFPGTPRLFSDDYATHSEIEQWELYAKTQLSEPIGILFGQAFSEAPDADQIAKANALFHERLGKVEEALSQGEFLVGDRMTLADIVVAAPLYLADQTAEMAGAHPVGKFFHDHLRFGEGREKTQAWVRRIVSHDPVKGREPAAV